MNTHQQRRAVSAQRVFLRRAIAAALLVMLAAMIAKGVQSLSQGSARAVQMGMNQ